MNSRGTLVGCTIGNDMSSRDIEGANLLYLPQAKVYDRSCAVGPWIVLATDEAAIRRWTISVAIARGGSDVFSGETGVDKIKRSFQDLIGHLRRSQSFPRGAVLLTVLTNSRRAALLRCFGVSSVNPSSTKPWGAITSYLSVRSRYL
jgi:2-dehydro-3-deoxy-D-arabinonate dehydratase